MNMKKIIFTIALTCLITSNAQNATTNGTILLDDATSRTRVVVDAFLNSSNRVHELIQEIASSYEGDFTTNNTVLVNTIETVSPKTSLEPATNYTDAATNALPRVAESSEYPGVAEYSVHAFFAGRAAESDFAERTENANLADALRGSNGNRTSDQIFAQLDSAATPDGVTNIVTNVVTKAYVESLGIESGVSAEMVTNIAESVAASATSNIVTKSYVEGLGIEAGISAETATNIAEVVAQTSLVTATNYTDALEAKITSGAIRADEANWAAWANNAGNADIAGSADTASALNGDSGQSRSADQIFAQLDSAATPDGVTNIVTNVVTKAYVESLGIESGVSAEMVTNIAESVAASATSNIVTKSYVEGLGIEAGISAETATNIAEYLITPIQLKDWYPDGSVTNESQFTHGMKYELNINDRTATLYPFCVAGYPNLSNSDISGIVIVPPYIDNDGIKYKVIAIGFDNVFLNDYVNTNLTAIIAPTTVTIIKGNAFYKCKSLSYVSLPAITSIGKHAFDNTAISSISYPSVTNIDDYAFLGCTSLSHISLPAVLSIGQYAFRYDNSISYISLPAATNIEGYAFADCTSLSSISLPSAKRIGAFAFYNTSISSISLPSIKHLYDDERSFGNGNSSSLLYISLPAVTNIGEWAFNSNTSILYVSIPSAMRIGNYAFRDCKSISAIDFGNSLSSVPSLGGSYVFYNGPTNCVIVVPDSLYTSWITSSGWSRLISSGYKFVKHSEWKCVRQFELIGDITNIAQTTAADVVANADTTYRRTIGVTNLNQTVQYVSITDTAPTTLAISMPTDGATKDWMVYVTAVTNVTLQLPPVTWWMADSSATNDIPPATPTALWFSQVTDGIFIIGRQELTEVTAP